MRRQVIELARSGTRVEQLAVTFAISEATVYNWTKQDKIDRGERDGLSTDQAIELMAAKRRIKQLETERAVARKVNEVFLRHDLAQKPLPGDRRSDRAGNRRSPRLPNLGCLGVRLLRVEGQAAGPGRPAATVARMVQRLMREHRLPKPVRSEQRRRRPGYFQARAPTSCGIWT